MRAKLEASFSLSLSLFGFDCARDSQPNELKEKKQSRSQRFIIAITITIITISI